MVYNRRSDYTELDPENVLSPRDRRPSESQRHARSLHIKAALTRSHSARSAPRSLDRAHVSGWVGGTYAIAGVSGPQK